MGCSGLCSDRWGSVVNRLCCTAGGLRKWLSEGRWFCLWDLCVVSWWEPSCNKAQTWIRGTCVNKPVVALISAPSAITAYLRVYFKRLTKERGRQLQLSFPTWNNMVQMLGKVHVCMCACTCMCVWVCVGR